MGTRRSMQFQSFRGDSLTQLLCRHFVEQQQQLSSSPSYSVLSMESSASNSASEGSNAKYQSSNSPSSQSNMSPQSTNSDNSSYNMQNLNISTSYHYYSPQSVGGEDGQLQTFTYTAHGNASEPQRIELSVPHLVILEQPVDKFRFRYQSEMHGTHGSLMGVRTEKSKKTFPTVELRGYQGEAKIRCSLFQVDPSKRAAHSHHLVIKSGEIDLVDPHDIEVNAESGYVAMFQGMGIIHTAKKNIAEELCKKIKKHRSVELNRDLTLREEHQMHKEAGEMAKSMNLNQVCLCFQAFQVDPVSGHWTQLCEPVYSNAINNMKSALTGELKICRLSATAGSVDGGEEVFMFVEKVCKNNIKIRFYELDEYDQEIWQDWGMFSEADVHHQYAIAFKTPAYHNKDITEPVEVYMQLFRPRDKCQSEPVPYKYKPRPGMAILPSSSRKRARVHSGNISAEIPTVVPNDSLAGTSRLPPMHQPFPMVGDTGGQMGSDTNTISKEFNKAGLIQEIIDSQIPTTIAGDISFSSSDFKEFVNCNSEDLHKLITEISEAQELGKLETDAVTTTVNHVDGEAARFERALERYLDEHRQAVDVDILKKILAIVRLFRRDYEKCRELKCRELISALWMSSNKQKANCLHMAIERRNASISRHLIELLQAYQLLFLIDLSNERSETALHRAISGNVPELVQLLLEAGSKTNICDQRGNSALHRAVVENAGESLAVLINHCKRIGARLDITNDDGCTVLHMAVMHKNLKLVRMLLEKGASPSQRDLKHGNNILHIAVESGSLDMVNYILESVDPSLGVEPNNAGYTPLQLANAKHHTNPNYKLIVREMLRFNPAGVLEKDSSIDEDEDDSDQANESGIKSDRSSPAEGILQSMNLTCNQVEVIRILEDHHSPDSADHSSTELTPLKNVPFNGTDHHLVECHVSYLFDEECLTALCELLNRSGMWRELGSLLDFNAFFTIWEQSANPTEMLLNYFEMQEMKLDHLISILQVLEQKDAIRCIDEMVCRQMK
ncbi:LOW QUALITY PROTEIN: nuclear factor NF-kappa-B p110 subunit [Uranotaenia lowii]|uniref:LOW QUALITY PROTEIN: nuclear factor NF-kappa-B p110 subunit n=1 Tax=Uranotaenia lowii TaxID=190385 RepID=UPI00247A33F7|nr:LOW QUALITY PROTEIN: nuclear factor NF-kappa-B p110 subunit [Uranotaenia lowii]